MLPEWLDVERLNFALIAGIAALVLAAVLALRLIKRLALALAISLLLVGGAAGLAAQWSGLRECRETCTCQAFGQQVQVPQNPLCGPNRVSLGSINRSRIGLSGDGTQDEPGNGENEADSNAGAQDR